MTSQTECAINFSTGFGTPPKDSDTWYLSSRQQSLTFLKLEMIPAERTLLELEKSHEDRLSNLLAEVYPRIRDTVRGNVANEAESRGADFYEYAWYHKELDYEGRWRITGTGDIGHATQMKYEFEGAEKVWSVVDLANYVILFVRLSLKWWESIRYFGEAYLYVQLSVPGLGVQRSLDGYYTHAFDPTYSPRREIMLPSIRRDAILLAASSREAANAEIKLTYFSGKNKLPRLTTSILNQLLRSLGHVVIWDALQRSIESLVED